MKIRITMLGVALALGGPLYGQQNPNDTVTPQTPPTHAAEQGVVNTKNTAPANSVNIQALPRMGELERADKMLGREVKGTDDKRLGTVKDLAIDMRNGRLVAVIIGSGGVLGLDEKYREVPPGALTCDDTSKTFHLNVDSARFEQASFFKSSDLKANLGREEVNDAYKYYNLTPAYQWTDLGEINRAKNVIGAAVQNTQGDRIGKVEDLMIDKSSDRVTEVVVASGGFLGMGDEYSAVPPQAFRPGTSDNTLLLDTTKEALTQAPHFKGSDWDHATQPDQVVLVYRSYNIQPYFQSGDADNTAQNRVDRTTGSLTPLQQGRSQADLEMTRQIRRAIMDAGNFSVDAQNIKIITRDGHVTLRGSVKTQDEKRRIHEIAATKAQEANVDDQLRVENLPTASANQ